MPASLEACCMGFAQVWTLEQAILTQHFEDTKIPSTNILLYH